VTLPRILTEDGRMIDLRDSHPLNTPFEMDSIREPRQQETVWRAPQELNQDSARIMTEAGIFIDLSPDIPNAAVSIEDRIGTCVTFSSTIGHPMGRPTGQGPVAMRRGWYRLPGVALALFGRSMT
jgi:hypothetical protein